MQQQAKGQAWRQEVASRVRQHRARRRANADPNAMELDFTAEEPYSFSAEASSVALPPPPDRFAEIMVKAEKKKVIRFPRPAASPLPAVEEVRMEELAAPVFDAPRIEEAPSPEPEFVESGFIEELITPPSVTPPAAEQMELLPSFADIHLEPETNRLAEELDGIPRPAPLSQRLVAGMVDAGIVFIAGGVFALTFIELAEELPQSRLTVAFGLLAGGVFWLVFQYLFLAHGRRTPGMRLAQLELCTFSGKPPSLFARQCRALAGGLSGFAAGLGYLWSFIDEDRVGWHDRISQTYLRSTLLPSAARDPYEYDDLKG